MDSAEFTCNIAFNFSKSNANESFTIKIFSFMYNHDQSQLNEKCVDYKYSNWKVAGSCCVARVYLFNLMLNCVRFHSAQQWFGATAQSVIFQCEKKAFSQWNSFYYIHTKCNLSIETNLHVGGTYRLLLDLITIKMITINLWCEYHKVAAV